MSPDFEAFQSPFSEAISILVEIIFDIVSMDASKGDLMLDLEFIEKNF